MRGGANQGRRGVEIAGNRVYEAKMITAILTTRDNEIDLAFALAPLVSAAVEGVLREVIVVDDGSRDGTVAVADAAGCKIVRGVAATL